MKLNNHHQLKPYAMKYIWWKKPEEALKMPDRIIAQVMDIGDYEDVQSLLELVGKDFLIKVLTNAEIGQFSERSWTYWHYRLGLSPKNPIPPLPQKRFQ